MSHNSSSSHTTQTTTTNPPQNPIISIKQNLQAHLSALLNNLNLSRHLNSASTPASDSAAYPYLFQHDQLLLTAILSSLSLDIHSLVALSEPVVDAWNTLSQRFASMSRSRVFQLKKDPAKIQLGSLSIAEFLQQIKANVDELAVIGRQLSDDGVALYVLDGLGPNYTEFVSFIQACYTSITFSELHDKVIAQESYLKKIEIHNSNPQAD